MTELLSQNQIEEITSRRKPTAQRRHLERLGFVVIGVNAQGRLQCIATHPEDPSVHAESQRGDLVSLNI